MALDGGDFIEIGRAEMMNWWPLYLLLGGALGVWGLFWWLGRRRLEEREILRGKALTEEEWGWIDGSVRLVAEASEELREELGGIVQILRAEKRFEACGGLTEVTGEMKMVILAQAALLLTGRAQGFFPRLRSILVYPDTYMADREGEGHEARLGESWGSGSVVLAWRSVVAGGRNDEDGQNVVLHEFAHQLDQDDGAADGLPLLADGMRHAEWAAAFVRSYERFCDEVEEGRDTFLDPYGATNPAEFFAVATETYFEKRRRMEREEPEVFRQLEVYYGGGD